MESRRLPGALMQHDSAFHGVVYRVLECAVNVIVLKFLLGHSN
jgi:hypothetical protein